MWRSRSRSSSQSSTRRPRRRKQEEEEDQEDEIVVLNDDHEYRRGRHLDHEDEDDEDKEADGSLNPWEEAFQRRMAMRRLFCALCKVGADSEAAMERHLDGGRHLKELYGFREDLCRRNAEATGGHPVRLRLPGRRERVLPDIRERLKEWNLRYKTGKYPTNIASVHLVMGSSDARAGVKIVKKKEPLEQPIAIQILTPSLITTSCIAVGVALVPLLVG